MKPSGALCVALIEGWTADAQLCRMDGTLLDELATHSGYRPDTARRMRVFVAEHNVMANNALWDQHRSLAFDLMRKHGFKDGKRADIPTREVNALHKRINVEVGLAVARKEAGSAKAWNTTKGRHRFR